MIDCPSLCAYLLRTDASYQAQASSTAAVVSTQTGYGYDSGYAPLSEGSYGYKHKRGSGVLRAGKRRIASGGR